MAEPEKPPFYWSCMFWITLAIVGYIIADTLAVFIPAWKAAKAQREQQTVEQVEQE